MPTRWWTGTTVRLNLGGEHRPARGGVASVHLGLDGAPDGLNEEAQALDDGLHIHHGGDAGAPVFHRPADLRDFDPQLGEVIGQARLGEHEQGLDALALGHGDDGQVETDGDVGKARLVLGAEVFVAEGHGRLGFALPAPVLGAYGEA